MLEPHGPLPPEIYWRRRILAIVVAVVVLASVVWVVLALTGGDDPETEPAAAAVTTTTTSTEAPDPSADETAAGTGGSGRGGGDATSGGSDSGGSNNGGSGGGGSGGSDSTGRAGTTTSSPATVGTTAAAASVVDGQCSDQSLAVRVTAGEPNYPAGAEPEFTIVITNIGTVPCERDLGAGLQQVLVYTLDGNDRLWSNTDCFPESTTDVRSLGPGDQAAFTVKWSGTTSEPGCQAPREPVGPGAYTVVGQLGGLRSTPEPFNITP